jgi:hypothetical protein
VAVLAALVLAVPTALVQSGSVTAADGAPPPNEDCATAYPISQVTQGQAVTGLTTSQGTTPTGFTGTVLGVLKDGVLPGIDLVMARLDSSEIQRVGGIWQGMSGSPVYASNGQLIGAVAYGFSFGPSPVAGITPFSQMQTSLNRTLPAKLKVGDRTARLLARSAGVSRAAASEGFAQLPTPMSVAGVPASVLNRKPTRPYESTSAAHPVGAASAGAAPTAADIRAGAGLGVTFSTGDITMGAMGTVTSVCNGLVRGFGHPFNLLGKTSYAMTGVDALYVQEDPAGPPFIMGNFGTPLGTVNQDRTVGVSGPLGVLPTGTTVTNVLAHGTAQRTSTSTVTVQQALALVTNYGIVVNHQSVLDSFPPGGEVQEWTITGHDGSTPFTLHGGDRYADSYDITGISQWDLPDLVYALGFVPTVKIDSIAGFSTVTDDATTYRLAHVEQWRSGQWVKVTRTSPARGKAGHLLRLRMVLTNPAGKTSVPLVYKLPAKAAGQKAKLFVNPGQYFPFEQEQPPTTFAGIEKWLTDMVRTDQVRGDLTFFGPKGAITRSKKSASVDRVITGGLRVNVIVD